jgi:hypothetical protein
MTGLRGFFFAVTVIACAPGARAVADPPSPSPSTYEAVFKPLLRSERDYADLGPAGPFYPQAAISREHGRATARPGEAVLECRTRRSGELSGCKVILSRPLEEFGLAARALASQRRIGVSSELPEGQIVRVHVPFDPSTPAQIAP